MTVLKKEQEFQKNKNKLLYEKKIKDSIENSRNLKIKNFEIEKNQRKINV